VLAAVVRWLPVREVDGGRVLMEDDPSVTECPRGAHQACVAGSAVACRMFHRPGSSALCASNLSTDLTLEQPMNGKRLQQLVQDLRSQIPGIIATDIWDVATGLSLAGYNEQPIAVALFNDLTSTLERVLAQSGFPRLKRYYVLDLEGATGVVIMHGSDIRQGILFDAEQTTIGQVLTFGLKMSLAGVADARD
jgi:hypothetical protein